MEPELELAMAPESRNSVHDRKELVYDVIGELSRTCSALGNAWLNDSYDSSGISGCDIAALYPYDILGDTFLIAQKQDVCGRRAFRRILRL